MYVDDCVEGIVRIMESGHPEPLNLGTDELVTIDGLVDMVAEIPARPPQAPRHDEAAGRAWS